MCEKYLQISDLLAVFLGLLPGFQARRPSQASSMVFSTLGDRRPSRASTEASLIHATRAFSAESTAGKQYLHFRHVC